MVDKALLITYHFEFDNCFGLNMCIVTLDTNGDQLASAFMSTGPN